MRNLLTIATLIALLGGCRLVGHHVLVDPGDNRVLEVEQGDVVDFELEENMTTGYRWQAQCDDSEIEVAIEHVPANSAPGFCGAPGKAVFKIEVGRSFSGPATVRVQYKRTWEKDPIREFSLSLFRR